MINTNSVGLQVYWSYMKNRVTHLKGPGIHHLCHIQIKAILYRRQEKNKITHDKFEAMEKFLDSFKFFEYSHEAQHEPNIQSQMEQVLCLTWHETQCQFLMHTITSRPLVCTLYH